MREIMVRRCALACDVLLKMNAKLLMAQLGTYVGVKDALGCRVCAIGGLIVAATHHYDGVCAGQVTDSLAEFWSARELAVIEAAFEGPEGTPYIARTVFPMGQSQWPVEMVQAWEMFSGRAKIPHTTVTPAQYGDIDSDYRLRSVMANILIHNGTFMAGLGEVVRLLCG